MSARLKAPAPGPRPLDELIATRAAHWPESVTPVTGLMVRVFRLGGMALQQAAELVAAQGLTFKEFEVLATLRSFPAGAEVTPGDLCAAVLISSGGLTKVLYGLEDRGLLARAGATIDRRSKPVRLTAKGRRAAERAMAAIIRNDADVVARALTAREVETLTDLVGKALGAMEAPVRRSDKDVRK